MNDSETLTDEIGYIRAYCFNCEAHVQDAKRHESYGHSTNR